MKVFCKKTCSEIFQIFHRETPVLESFVNKAAGLRACNFIKRRVRHRYFPVKFAKLLRIPILKNICEQLYLSDSCKNIPTNNGISNFARHLQCFWYSALISFTARILKIFIELHLSIRKKGNEKPKIFATIYK